VLFRVRQTNAGGVLRLVDFVRKVEQPDQENIFQLHLLDARHEFVFVFFGV
jgi:hypothetical protein